MEQVINKTSIRNFGTVLGGQVTFIGAGNSVIFVRQNLLMRKLI